MRRGKEWGFGMRVHVGTDRRRVAHSLTTTDAAASEINQRPSLVHGEERALYGDRAFWSVHALCNIKFVFPVLLASLRMESPKCRSFPVP